MKLHRLLSGIQQNCELDVSVPVGDPDRVPVGEHVLHHPEGDDHRVFGREIVLIHVTSWNTKVRGWRHAERVERVSGSFNDFDSRHVDGFARDEKESELSKEVKGRDFLQILAILGSPVARTIAVEVRQTPVIVLTSYQNGTAEGQRDQTDGDEKV